MRNMLTVKIQTIKAEVYSRVVANMLWMVSRPEQLLMLASVSIATELEPIIREGVRHEGR